MTSLQQTEQFMRAAGQDIPSVPTVPSEDVRLLRLSLIREELSELTRAFVDKDLVEVLDALADLQVVLDGAVLACGLKGVFQAALNEVYRSNMSKFCDDRIEAEETVHRYTEAGTPAEAVVIDTWEGGIPRRYAVRRLSDGKVLKSVLYSPANLAPLLAEASPTARTS